MENQPNLTAEKRELISRDSYKITRILAGLEYYKGILDVAFQKIELRFGIIATTEHIKDITCDRGILLKQQISDAYDLESNKYTFPHAKQQFLDGKNEAYEEVDKLVKEVEAEQEHPSKIGANYLTAWERLKYLSCENGVVEVLADDVVEDNSYYACGNAVNELKERAKALFAQMESFDRDVRLLSDNQVMGVYDATPGYNAIITCSGDRLWLDFNHLKHLDFDNAEALLASEPKFHIEESVICKVEEL